MNAVALDVDRGGGVATITLSAPERRNALTGPMARELERALGGAGADHDVRAIVLRGAGGFFCAGADRAAIRTAQADPAQADTFADFDAIYSTFVTLAEMPVPTIAAVRGGAVGAGLNLALAADIRIVADSARLLSGFLRIGVHPGGAHFQLLERLIGAERAAAMALLGVELDGTTAAAWGLALEAVADAEVEPRAQALAAQSVADGPLVRMATASWRAYRAAAELPLRLLLRAEQAPQMWSFRRGG
jgi:enoyl-CoA hydratase